MAAASTFAAATARPLNRGRLLIYVVGYHEKHYNRIPEEIWNDAAAGSFVDVRKMLPSDPANKRAKGESLVDNVVKQPGFADAVTASVEAAMTHGRVFVGCQPPEGYVDRCTLRDRGIVGGT